MQTYLTSAFGKLDSSDYFKGLKVAVWSALLTFVYPFLVQHSLPDFKTTLYIVAIATCGYLLKNLTTPAVQVSTAEPIA